MDEKRSLERQWQQQQRKLLFRQKFQYIFSRIILQSIQIYSAKLVHIMEGDSTMGIYNASK